MIYYRHQRETRKEENKMYETKREYYRELLTNTFPLTKSDMQSVIKRDAYESLVVGSISNDEHQKLVEEFL